MTADSARCAHLRALPRSLWGDLSVIMHLGDLVFREEGIPCFDPDADILLPAFNPQQREPDYVLLPHSMHHVAFAICVLHVGFASCHCVT